MHSAGILTLSVIVTSCLKHRIPRKQVPAIGSSDSIAHQCSQVAIGVFFLLPSPAVMTAPTCWEAETDSFSLGAPLPRLAQAAVKTLRFISKNRPWHICSCQKPFTHSRMVGFEVFRAHFQRMGMLILAFIILPGQLGWALECLITCIIRPAHLDHLRLLATVVLVDIHIIHPAYFHKVHHLLDRPDLLGPLGHPEVILQAILIILLGLMVHLDLPAHLGLPVPQVAVALRSHLSPDLRRSVGCHLRHGHQEDRIR